MTSHDAPFDASQFPCKRPRLSTPRPSHDEGQLKRKSHVDHAPDWGFWGPYLSDRQWGTVREDYSWDGDCWNDCSYDDAVKRVYTSGEDGLFGLTDDQGLFCMSLALWNGADPMLKERLFGLTGPRGNHGEDVKELYYYLDNIPDHSYMKALYKYPQDSFPYEDLEETSQTRTLADPEYEILDTGIFNDSNHWDIYVEYTKPDSMSVACRYTAVNRGGKEATLTVLPHFWFRNTWYNNVDSVVKPSLCKSGKSTVKVQFERGDFVVNFFKEKCPGDNTDDPLLLFTENEDTVTMTTDLADRFLKHAFHKYIVDGIKDAVNTDSQGTKCCGVYTLTVPPGGQSQVTWLLVPGSASAQLPSLTEVDKIFKRNKEKADRFYQQKIPATVKDEWRLLTRQVWAGLLWSKQYYIYNIKHWQDELVCRESKTDSPEFSTEQTDTGTSVYNRVDSETTAGSQSELRNSKWQHIDNHDILLMPDKWEFPWYSGWDSCFHSVSVVSIDPTLAKHQMTTLLSPRYMHPSGQLPGCEFNFDDPNPPLQAWACKTIFCRSGSSDISFLQHCFSRLLLNFSWWMEHRCLGEGGGGLFYGGFLGMDNISVFNRSQNIPGGYKQAQADATGWMIHFCLNMLDISCTLALHDKAYEDDAVQFLRIFQMLSWTLNSDISLIGCWSEKDSFYYDVLISPDGSRVPVPIKSLVGLVSLTAQIQLNWSTVNQLPKFKSAVHELLKSAPDLVYAGERTVLLSGVHFSRVEKIIDRYLGNEEEFLSPFGFRSLSKVYDEEPFRFVHADEVFTLRFTPGESTSDMFGGNSNWRGPIWLCVNYLLMESLFSYTSCKKAGSVTGWLAVEVCRRVASIFLLGSDSGRPLHGGEKFYEKPDCRDLILFYEYYHSETGRGCGASHQTGWSALVVEFLSRLTTS